MQIKILNVGEIESRRGPKKTYKVFQLAYSLDQQSRDKAIMEFSAVFKVLSKAQPGEVYEIESKKNDAGYVDWLSAVKVGEAGAAPAASATSASKGAQVSKGTWETPEERAARQVMIVRQSSISSAVALIAAGGEPGRATVGDTIELAKAFEAYVMGTDEFKDDNLNGDVDVE